MARRRINVRVAQENKENFKLRPQVKVTKLLPKYKQNPKTKETQGKVTNWKTCEFSGQKLCNSLE